MKRLFISLLLLAPRLLLAQPDAAAPEALLATANDQVNAARVAADPPALIGALESLGHAHLELADPDRALAAFRESLKLARETADASAIARNLLAIGRIHVQQGRASAGAETLKRAVAAAEGLGADELLRDAHDASSEAYAALGQHRQAYESARRATELDGSLASRRHAELIAGLEAKHEAERRAWAAEAAARQRQEPPGQLRPAGLWESRRRWLAALGLGGGALLLLLTALITRQWITSQTSAAMAKSSAQLRQNKDELARARSERERLQASSDHARGESERLAAELAATAGERDRLSGELAQTAGKLERTADQLEHTFVELKQTSSDRDRAVAELAQSAGDRQRHASALEQASAESARVSTELEHAAGERDRLGAQLQHTTAEAERISDRLMQTAGELERTTAERDRLVDQLARTTDELEQLHTDCRQDISAMADRNSLARDRLAEMERWNSTLSQHLKVLLVAVRSSLDALQQDAAAGDVEQLQKDVRRTHLAVGKTVRLLDELQKLLLVGRVVHAPEAASMSELAFEAIGQVTGLADRRVEVVIAPVMPAIYGDRSQLLEVLNRLLENGGKFMGAQPSPRLQVGHRRDWPRADLAQDVFYVRDNGIGIEPRDHERVFSLFEKVDPQTEGMGIGLPLVKRIVEAHGGRVWVESDGAGRGSTFCFTLSRKYAAPPMTPPPQPAEPAGLP